PSSSSRPTISRASSGSGSGGARGLAGARDAPFASAPPAGPGPSPRQSPPPVASPTGPAHPQRPPQGSPQRSPQRSPQSPARNPERLARDGHDPRGSGCAALAAPLLYAWRDDRHRRPTAAPAAAAPFHGFRADAALGGESRWSQSRRGEPRVRPGAGYKHARPAEFGGAAGGRAERRRRPALERTTRQPRSHP